MPNQLAAPSVSRGAVFTRRYEANEADVAVEYVAPPVPRFPGPAPLPFVPELVGVPVTAAVSPLVRYWPKSVAS
jgi:hypothetical protein